MKNVQASHKSPRQPPLFSRYVLFSVTLFLIILVAGSAAFLFSMRQIIRDNKGRELSKLLELERVKLEMSVDREIAIVLKMATSPMIQRYFEDPGDRDLKRLAQEDIDAYRRSLSGSVFWVNDIDKMFYFDDEQPYKLDADMPENYWYHMTLNDTDTYNFNINYNPDLKLTNLWINAPVFNASGKPVGMLGAGIDLTAFVNVVYKGYQGKAAFYFFNEAGEVTGARDIELVAGKKNIQNFFSIADEDILSRAKELADDEVQTFAASMGQVAIICVSKLKWYAVAVWPDKLEDFNTALTTFFCLGILMIALILILSNIFIAKLLTPLRETMASLESASKAKSDFLARMSHEIRTPMNAIIGIVQIQMQKPNLPHDFENALDRIYGSGTLLLGIINDILDMSKIETGKLRLNPAEYDVPSLINDSVQFNIARLESKPVELRLNVNEKLPSRLIGDEMRLKQILNNLLSNAFKYTTHGSVDLTVSHTEAGGDVILTIKVADTGQGIKEEDKKLLFSEYQRFNEGANRYTEGVGLGLNITWRIVAMMGGSIDVESEYGKGSTFTATVMQKAVPGAEIIGEELSKRLRNFTFTGIRHSEHITRERMPYGSVLIVDDVETNLLVAEGLMSLYGLRIETAGSGLAVIEKIRSGKVYDIIFMDHMMPVMDGVETTKELRCSGYAGTIVALTANAILGSEEMFTKNGFDGFISKPIDVRRLDTVLNRFIRAKYRGSETGLSNGSGDGGESHSGQPQDKGSGETTDRQTLAAPRAVRPVQLNERLKNALRSDVEKSVVTLRGTLANGNVALFTTTVHGLKSALASIGEKEKSEQAFALELAGRKNDMDYISAHAEIFIKALEELIK